MTYADRMFAYSVSGDTRKLHFEFQSTVDESIASRMFFYGCGHGIIKEPQGNLEIVQLPTSALVSVREEVDYSKDYRDLLIKVNSQELKIRYPVVKGYTCLPCLYDLMRTRDLHTWFDVFLQFAAKLSIPENDLDYRKLMFACRLISHSEVFEQSGVMEDYVMDEVRRVAPRMPKLYEVIEQAKKEGAEEQARLAREQTQCMRDAYAKAVAKRFGVSYEQALSILDDSDNDIQSMRPDVGLIKLDK